MISPDGPLSLLPDNIRSVQPGGGFCYQAELAWGRWRRAYLKRFRPRYVDRMSRLRRGDATGSPHEILDPRDLKYCSNLCTASWDPDDDPYRWRDRLPVTRWGLAEVQIMGWPLIGAAIALLALESWPRWLAVGPLAMLLLLVYFFRNPRRLIPSEAAAIVSPADGAVAEIADVDHYEFFDGPAVRIGIFLSIFNVHLNRAPRNARVVELHYKPGEFLNALDPESALRNECLWIGLEDVERRRQRLAVRQISGLFARRIVCALRPGQEVRRGESFGMIKLGSRTELVLPRDAVRVDVRVGQKVRAGRDVLAHYVD